MISNNEANITHKSSEYVLCVINPNGFAYSETFIRAHIEKLPTTVKVLYGDYFPTHMVDSKPLLSTSLPQRIVRTLLRRVLRLPPQHFPKEALKRFFKMHKVNAVLAEYGQTGVAVMDACQEADIPLIVHFHGYDAFDQRVVDVYDKKYLRLFEVAASIIAASQSMRSRLLELGTPAEKIFVNPYGVDTSLFSSANPALSPPVFVAIGRFVDKKAPHLTLLSFKSVLEQCREARLIMVGEGPLLEACKLMANALGISSSVDFLGIRSPSEIAVILRSARAFVQHSISTSYGDSESLGVVFLEAGAAGLPAITTRHDGIPEVILHEETGFLVDEGDIDKMAECMIRLAKDPGLAARLGKAARERICAEFFIEKSISYLWSTIEEVIQRHGRYDIPHSPR